MNGKYWGSIVTWIYGCAGTVGGKELGKQYTKHNKINSFTLNLYDLVKNAKGIYNIIKYEFIVKCNMKCRNYKKNTFVDLENYLAYS